MTAWQAGTRHKESPLGRTNIQQHGPEFPCRSTGTCPNNRWRRTTGRLRKRGGDNIGGKLYSENNVAALKGYCGVVDPRRIPSIWNGFQQTRELAQHRHNLRVGMMTWSKQTGMDIDKAPFFAKATNKDIVNLNFNPGKAVPTYLSAQRGLSILTCRPKSAHEVELIKDFKEARRATAHTAQFNEVHRHQKAQPSAPPDNYHNLCLSVNTFCALIWMLFEEECNYYKGMLEIGDTLDLQEVHIIQESFTPDVCRRITWAILTDGRSFFNTVLVESQFRQRQRIKWPTSLIHKIVDDVRYAETIHRPMYPTEWVIATNHTQIMGGGSGRGGGGRAGGAGGGGRGGAGGGGRGQGNVSGGGRNAGGTGGGLRRGQNQQRQSWVDKRHPKIAAMMAD